MKKIITIPYLAIVLICCYSFVYAGSSSSTNYHLQRHVKPMSGNLSNSQNYEAKNTTGQTVTGTLLYDSYIVEAGYWANANTNPYDITLSVSSVAENNVAGLSIATISSSDYDANDPHAYSLVSGDGDTDNSSFTINGTELIASSVFDYETKSNYSIRVRASDSHYGWSESIIVIQVENTNDAPAFSTSISDLTINEDAGSTEITFTAADPETSPCSLSLSITSSDPTLFPESNLFYTCHVNTYTFTFTPAANQSGQATISLLLTDAGGLTATTSFIVTVTEMNDPPTVAMSISDQSIDEFSELYVPLNPDIFNDIDQGDSLTYTATLSDGNPLPEWLSFNPSTLILSGTPIQDDIGSIEIKVIATDTSSASVENTFTITIADRIDNLPMVSTNYQMPRYVAPMGGVISDSPNFQKKATTGQDVTGIQTMSSKILKAGYWAKANSNPANMTLSAFTVSENNVTGVTIAIISSMDYDHGDTHVYSLVSGDGDTDNASFTLNGTALIANDIFDYETQNTYSLRLRATDSSYGWSETIMMIQVENNNDAPAFTSSISDQTINEDASAAEITFTAADPETVPCSLILSITSSDQTLFPESNLLYTCNGSTYTLTFTPEANQSGLATITLLLTDPGGLTATTSFIVNVTEINDPPTVAMSISDQSIDEFSELYLVLNPDIFNDIDPGDSLTWTATLSDGNPLPEWLSFNPTTLILSGTPIQDDIGSIEIKVTATDTSSASVENTFTITIADRIDNLPMVSTNYQMPRYVAPMGGVISDSPNFQKKATTGQDVTGIQTMSSKILKAGYWAKANSNPANMTLSDFTVAENNVIGMTIAVISSMDYDNGDTHVYSLVSGDGDTDNASFTLNGTALIANDIFDYETQSTYSLRLRATDSNYGWSETIMLIQVENNNDAPAFTSSISDQTINEDASAAEITFTAADPETAPCSLILTITSSDQTLFPESNLLYTCNGSTYTLTFTPAANQSGVATITLLLTDPGGLTATTSFIVTVTETNDPPTVAMSISDQRIDEFSELYLVLNPDIFNDIDPGDSLTFTATLSDGNPLPEWLSFNPTTLILSGTPIQDDIGSIEIKVTATDTSSASVENTFTITIADRIDNLPMVSTNYQMPRYVAPMGGVISDSPNFQKKATTGQDVTGIQTMSSKILKAGYWAKANSNPANMTLSAFTVAENNVIGMTIAVISSMDYDHGDTHVYSLVSGDGDTDNASFTLNGTALIANDIFDYETQNTYSIRLRATDSNYGWSETIMLIQVENNNDAPAFTSSISDQTINEDASAAEITFTASDPETAPCSLVLSITSSDQTLFPESNLLYTCNGSTYTLTFTPAANQSGVATITLLLTDPGGLTATTSFIVNVTEINDPPTVAMSISDQSIDEFSELYLVLNPDIFNDIDPDDSLTFTATLSDGNPLPEWLSFNPTTLILSGTPIQDDIGSIEIKVTATDTSSASVENTFTITIADRIDNLPMVSTNYQMPRYVVPMGGVISDSPNFQKKATSGQDVTGIQTMSSKILKAGYWAKANSNPTQVTISLSTIAENNVAGLSIATISSLDYDTSDPHSYSLVSGNGDTDNAFFTINGTDLIANEAFDFETQNSYSIRIRTTDSNHGWSETIILIQVEDINEAPNFSAAISDQTFNEDESSDSITFTVTDAESSPCSMSLTMTSSDQTLFPENGLSYTCNDNNYTITATPAANQNGQATISLLLTDAGGLTATASFDLTVTAVNDSPVISLIPDQTTFEDIAISAIGFTITDAETDAASLTVSAFSSNLTLVAIENMVFSGADENRAFSITPKINAFGTALITISVTDGDLTDTSSFNLTVNAVNDIPVISPITDHTTNELTSYQINYTVTDIESTNLTVTAMSSNTTLIPQNNLTITHTGENYTLSITPVMAEAGTTHITITISDGDRMTETVFMFTVEEVVFNISGSVGYYFDSGSQPISNVVLSLSGKYAYSAATDSNGNYTLANVRPGNYTQTIEKTDVTGGIDISDAINILKAAITLKSLSCEQIIAGDVTMNDIVTPLDTAILARYIAGTISNVNDTNIRWRFIPEMVADCSSWPPIPYSNISNLLITDDISGQDFIGILLGDVDGNWGP